MLKHCLKCGHANPSATGAELDACPECGAIYSRVETAQAAQTAARASTPSNLERVRAAKTDEHQRKTLRWQYGIIFACLAIAIPHQIYHEVWGIYAQQRKSERTARAAQAARAAAAPVVANSAWDGSVHQVERYLKQNLKDPGSFEAIEWSPVVKGANDSFMVRVKYRAKNSFGGYAIEQKVFRLDASGTVTGVSDL